jgi:peptidoglycan/xylan/chitin deacetylase (PgdA/CDA1 family)
VFIFHDVTPSPSAFQRAGRSFTTPDTFRRQVEWIAGRFTVVAPTGLSQLGGTRELAPNAAMISFDDAWAGVFRTALPILREHGLPSICFLNMGTVAGDPDLAAVRRYEATYSDSALFSDTSALDRHGAERIVSAVRERYGPDGAFRRYQGETATSDDLASASATNSVWFGSHLYHHWDLRTIGADVYEDSLRANAAALAGFANSVAAFATPHGHAGDVAVPTALGIRVMFTGTGNQNAVGTRFVLDRISIAPEPSQVYDWWYSAHRRRILGRIPS